MLRNVYATKPSPPKPDMKSNCDAAQSKMNLQIIESECLQTYKAPGQFQETRHVEWVRNTMDGSILLDHKGQPVSVDRLLATKPLRGELSSRPGPGGKKLTYLSGEGVTRTLNDIFGFDGWNLEIVKTQREECVKDDKGRFHVAYTAHVRLTHKKSGTYKEDVGASDSIDRSLGTAVSHALKGSITDALKRAARHFGEKLGNTLYQGNFTINKAPLTLKDALEEYDTETAKKKFGACTSVTKSETRNIETQQKESAQTNAAAAAQPPANENPKNNDNSASNATNNKAANNQQRPNQAQQQTQAKSNATAGNANMADKAHIMNQERQVSSAQTNPHHGTKTPAPVNPNLPNNSHAVVSATPVDRTLHSRNEGAAALNNRLGAPPKMNLPPAQSRQSFPPSCGTLLPFQQQNGLMPPPPLSATERLNQGMFAGINSQQQNMNKENTSLNDYKSAPNSNIQMARPETSKGRNTGSGGAKRPTPVVEAQGQPTQKRANPYRPY